MRHGLADDVRPAHHDRFHSFKRGRHGLGEDEAPKWRARHQRPLARRQPARVDRVKAVHILGWVDCLQHLRSVDMLGERQLHENAINGVIRVKPRDQREQLRLARFGGQTMLEGSHAGFHGLLGLGPDINLACRVFANQHNRKPRLYAMLLFQARHSSGHPAAQLGRDLFSVDDLCFRHVYPLRPAVLANPADCFPRLRQETISGLA